jgi:Zn ribbon nucleic-acid-binding protein
MRHTAVAAAFAALTLLSACSAIPASPGTYDDFAQCLAEENATFYGAYWCPNCAEQKQMFAGSDDELDYVECSLPNRGGQTAICQQKGINAYPTWIFADGERQEGVLSLETLADQTGCELPE